MHLVIEMYFDGTITEVCVCVFQVVVQPVVQQLLPASIVPQMICAVDTEAATGVFVRPRSIKTNF